MFTPDEIKRSHLIVKKAAIGANYLDNAIGSAGRWMGNPNTVGGAMSEWPTYGSPLPSVFHHPAAPTIGESIPRFGKGLFNSAWGMGVAPMIGQHGSSGIVENAGTAALRTGGQYLKGGWNAGKQLLHGNAQGAFNAFSNDIQQVPGYWKGVVSQPLQRAEYFDRANRQQNLMAPWSAAKHTWSENFGTPVSIEGQPERVYGRAIRWGNDSY